MDQKKRAAVACLATVIGLAQAELKRYPLDSMERILTKTGVEVDKVVSSDGKGSLRITAAGSRTVRLLETGDIDIENARLVYQARVRTQGVEGRVYLEMWCGFGSKGEYFSRGLDSTASGTADWTTLETSFSLQKGENPDQVKLKLIIDGKGTAWIDDIRLLKAPLQ